MTNNPPVALVLTNPPVIQTQPASELNRPLGSIVTFTLGVASALNYDSMAFEQNNSRTTVNIRSMPMS